MTHRATRALLVLAAAALLAVPAFPKDTVIDSAWAAAPVKIDGLSQEWQNVPKLTDKDSKAEYAFLNDGQNLYVLFVFKTPEAASTIEATGLKVYFDAGDKKSKDLGVHFLKKTLTADALIANLEKQGETLSEARKAELRQKKEYTLFEAEVINPKKIPAPSDPGATNLPPAFHAVRSREQGLIYELRIPLSRANEPGGIGAGPGRTIKLGFDWGGLTAEMKRAMMAPSGLSGANVGLNSNIANDRDDSARGGGAVLRHDPRSRQHGFWLDLKLASEAR
jgi:hypothetical protein